MQHQEELAGPMKRSQIDSLIYEAIEFLDAMNFKLPPWAKWEPAAWKGREKEAEEAFRCNLGWDLTDFGSGDFFKMGLLLFTLRNGTPGDASSKPYAEKAMIVRPGQVTPTHFHWRKTEDIINRGGGTLAMTLQMADEKDESRLSGKPFEVQVDGFTRLCQPGEAVRLAPGESICLTPRLYHSFMAEGAICLAGEVSSVNDDSNDNRFLHPCGRFPRIEEDEKPRYRLCTERPQ